MISIAVTLRGRKAYRLLEFMLRKSYKVRMYNWRYLYRCYTYKTFKKLKVDVNYMGPVFWTKRNMLTWLKTCNTYIIFGQIPDNKDFQEIQGYVHSLAAKGHSNKVATLYAQRLIH